MKENFCSCNDLCQISQKSRIYTVIDIQKINFIFLENGKCIKQIFSFKSKDTIGQKFIRWYFETLKNNISKIKARKCN